MRGRATRERLRALARAAKVLCDEVARRRLTAQPLLLWNFSGANDRRVRCSTIAARKRQPNVALSRRAADEAMIRRHRYVRTVGLNAWLDSRRC